MLKIDIVDIVLLFLPKWLSVCQLSTGLTWPDCCHWSSLVTILYLYITVSNTERHSGKNGWLLRLFFNFTTIISESRTLCVLLDYVLEQFESYSSNWVSVLNDSERSLIDFKHLRRSISLRALSRSKTDKILFLSTFEIIILL